MIKIELREILNLNLGKIGKFLNNFLVPYLLIHWTGINVLDLISGHIKNISVEISDHIKIIKMTALHTPTVTP